MSVCKALRLDEFGTKMTMASVPEIVDKKPFARGVFSAVFDGRSPNTVIKLTVDDIGYALLNDGVCSVNGAHFPKVVESFGDVGETKINGKSYPLFMFEMERLEKIANGSNAKKIVRKIGVSKDGAYKVSSKEESARLFSVMASDDNLPESIRSALDDLAMFCGFYSHAVADIHYANFMQRANGELVILDPVANFGIWDEAVLQVRKRGW